MSTKSSPPFPFSALFPPTLPVLRNLLNASQHFGLISSLQKSLIILGISVIQNHSFKMWTQVCQKSSGKETVLNMYKKRSY